VFTIAASTTVRMQLSVFIIITPALVDEAIALHSLCLLLLLLPLLVGSRGSWFAPGCLSRLWPSKCWPTCKGAQVCHAYVLQLLTSGIIQTQKCGRCLADSVS